MKDLPQPQHPMFLARVREVLNIFMGKAGNRGDRLPTLAELESAGLLRPSGPDGVIAGPAVDPEPDLTPPPTPTGFIATSGTTNILFETDPPVYSQGHGHARTYIYAANYSGVGPLPTFASAVEYTNFAGNIFAAPFDPASNLRLWVKWQSVDGVLSPPAGGTNGFVATTGLVDDAKIANLSAGKILAGSLAVGQHIQSADYVAGTTGWRIATLAGGGAFLEVNGGATIGGAAIGADFIRSTNYVAGTTGWRLKSDGTGQVGAFVITNDGIQSNNYVLNTSGWKLRNDGIAQIGGFVVLTAAIQSTNYVAGSAGWKLTNGGVFEAHTGTFAGSLLAANGSFTGSLSAATGTFSGTLTAAAVNAVNTINIAGNAVTIPVSASSATSINLLTAGEQTILTLPNFTSKGGQVVINFGGVTGATPDGSGFNDITGTFKVKRGATVVATYSVSFTPGLITLPPVTDTPGNGVSTTYTITYTFGSALATAGTLTTRAAYSLETIR